MIFRLINPLPPLGVSNLTSSSTSLFRSHLLKENGLSFQFRYLQKRKTLHCYIVFDEQKMGKAQHSTHRQTQSALESRRHDLVEIVDFHRPFGLIHTQQIRSYLGQYAAAGCGLSKFPYHHTY